MGAGNKMDPTAFKVGDIYQTSVDPIAKVMRRELKKRGIDSLKVVYSTEPPLKPQYTSTGAHCPGEQGPAQDDREHYNMECCESQNVGACKDREAVEAGTVVEGQMLAGTQKILGRKHPPGSIAFVPPVVGLIIAGEVVKDLISWQASR
jgi:tRNA A37 threonylcarbamoyladenosine dehydratase